MKIESFATGEHSNFPVTLRVTRGSRTVLEDDMSLDEIRAIIADLTETVAYVERTTGAYILTPEGKEELRELRRLSYLNNVSWARDEKSQMRLVELDFMEHQMAQDAPTGSRWPSPHTITEGMRVRHLAFGDGTVRSVGEEFGWLRALVVFDTEDTWSVSVEELTPIA